MAKKPEDKKASKQTLTRVTSDFGGRRKILDRRISPSGATRKERRSGKDRRSGFDRRTVLNQTEHSAPEKRKDPISPPIP
jgi:hypothetical protein